MIEFILGAFLGGIIGIVLMCLLIGGNRDDD